MIVLAKRAADAAVRKFQKAGTADFSVYDDYSRISPYAREAVEAFISQGWIQGYNRMINPKGLMTRAEAAVLIYRLYNAK
jgi:beta-glucosidase